jgi:hypothetical protein
MVIELYDALKDAGASEEKAKAAAQAMADYDCRFSKVEAGLLPLKWMVGFVLAGVVSIVAKSFAS